METIVFDGGGERKLLIGLITSKKFLLAIRNVMDLETISSRYARKLVEWCLAYYDKYSDVPGPDIEDLLKVSTENGTLDEDDGKSILKLLKSLDCEFKDAKFNVDHYLNGARRFLRISKVKSLKSKLEECLTADDIDRAESEITSFTKRSGELGSSKSLMDDDNAFMNAFDDEKEYLFRLPGAIGELLNEFFVRDSFIDFQAPEKTGKSFLLDDLAFHAWKSRCNVALIQCGDLSEKQQDRRMGIRMVGKSDILKYCYPQRIPLLDCSKNQRDDCNEEFRRCEFGISEKGQDESFEAWIERNRNYRPCTACRFEQGARFKDATWWRMSEKTDVLTWREAKRVQGLLRSGIRGKRFMIDYHASRTLSVTKLKSILDEWEMSRNFVPDVLVIDYSDIMDCEPGDRRLDKRMQEDNKWMALRGLSSERHLCLITATQSKIMVGEKELQDRSDFTESKTKYAHATAVFTINRTDKEEFEHTARIAPLMVRDGECNRYRSVKIFQALHKGRSFLDSCWHSELTLKKKNDFQKGKFGRKG